MDREKALQLVNKLGDKMKKHSLAVEAIMRELAEYLSENKELWGLVGLLHDIDYEETKNNPEKHGLIAADRLIGKLPDKAIYAIKAHNSRNGFEPKSKLDYALIASDAVSGLIIACALILPTKKLEDVTMDFVMKKFKQKDFARGASRERILYCEKIGLTKEKLFELALKGLQRINNELGL